VPHRPPALGPVHALVLDLPTLTPEQPPVLGAACGFADPWPGPVASGARPDGLNFARVAMALAPRPSADVRRAAGTADGALARCKFPRAALWRRAVVGERTLRCSPVPTRRRCNARTAPGKLIQFASAELVGDKTYPAVAAVARPQAGSEGSDGLTAACGAPFILLNDHGVNIASGLRRPL